jgi:hypothetical protein
MCDLCKHKEAVPGRWLCAVCEEAIVRLAGAVRAIEARASNKRIPPVAGHSAEDYRAAFFQGGG